MIVDAFVKAEMNSQPVARGKFDPRLPLGQIDAGQLKAGPIRSSLDDPSPAPFYETAISVLTRLSAFRNPFFHPGRCSDLGSVVPVETTGRAIAKWTKPLAGSMRRERVDRLPARRHLAS